MLRPVSPNVQSAKLQIVGGHDEPVTEMNRDAMRQKRAPVELEIVPATTRLFERRGVLAQIARLAARWCRRNSSPRCDVGLRGLIVTIATVGVAGCGATARYPVSTGAGPNPILPPPETSLFPTVNVVDATGWPPGGTPVSPGGTIVKAFARDLHHPRWLYVLPNGDLRVAETNAPPRPEYATGIKGWFFKRYQKKAGGAVPSANRITLLRDADKDGVAETRSILLSGLNSPFGMALVGDTLYVANSDALVRFPYSAGATQITAPAIKMLDLPAGPINQHWTKSLIASPDGSKLYIGVGSASNAAEHGINEEQGRAAIWEVDIRTGMHRIFASGLRNPVGWYGSRRPARSGRR